MRDKDRKNFSLSPIINAIHPASKLTHGLESTMERTDYFPGILVL
jgi:hypothetical protein